MHLIAVFFALLFSFCHASSIRHHVTEPLSAPAATSVEFVATESNVERAGTSYSDSECLSCRRTNVIFSVR